MLSACPPVVWLRPLGGSAGAGRGGSCTTCAGLDDQCDRPAPRARPQDRHGRSRREGARPAPAVSTGPVRGVRRLLPARLAGDPHLWARSTGLPRSATEGPIRRLLGGMQQPRVAARLRALPPGGQAARRGDRSSSGARGPVRLARGQQVHPDSRLAVRIVGGGDPVPRRGLHRHDQR